MVLILSTPCMACFGCISHESAIKKDLNSRFTKFEIVEIRKDISNIKTAMREELALEMITAETNLKIITALTDMNNKTKTPYQTYIYVDSVHKHLIELMTKFKNSRFNKVAPCYYVKYLVHKDEVKIPKEEYYYIDEINVDVSHRPIGWEDFLYELKYDVLIKRALEYDSEINELEWKYLKK